MRVYSLTYYTRDQLVGATKSNGTVHLWVRCVWCVETFFKVQIQYLVYHQVWRNKHVWGWHLELLAVPNFGVQLRLGCPVARVGFHQHTGPFSPGRPSSIAGSLGTWSWQPGHRIVVQPWGSMPATTSGMAVPPCRTCDRLGGVSFLLER